MKRIRVADYTPKSSDKFLFNNNIWMYLFCPIGNYNANMQDRCSSFFGKILDAGAKIYVTSLTLSEFSNKYFHIDFQIWKDGEEKDFKQDYRKTKRYQS